MAKPIVKWAGGKRRLLDAIRPHVPDDVQLIVEPFAGGAALTFDVEPPECILADACSPLMLTYRVMRRPELRAHLQARLELHAELHSKAYYLDQRRIFNEDSPRVLGNLLSNHLDHAARFLYFNRAGYNGMWRVNKKGGFNIPWGNRESVSWDWENFERVGTQLEGGAVLLNDWQAALMVAMKMTEWTPAPSRAMVAPERTLVYLDPPYLDTFSDHTRAGFSEEDHRELHATLCSLKLPWLLSHCEHPLYRELYDERDFVIETTSAHRSIAANASRRGKASELLIRPRK